MCRNRRGPICTSEMTLSGARFCSGRGRACGGLHSGARLQWERARTAAGGRRAFFLNEKSTSQFFVSAPPAPMIGPFHAADLIYSLRKKARRPQAPGCIRPVCVPARAPSHCRRAPLCDPPHARPLPLQKPAPLRVISLAQISPRRFRHIPPQAGRPRARFSGFLPHCPGDSFAPLFATGSRVRRGGVIPRNVYILK